MMRKENIYKSERGLTLVELLISIAIISIITGALAQLTGGALDSWRDSKSKGDLLNTAQIVMERMVSKVRDTSWVLIPLKISDPTDPGYPTSSYFPRDILAVSGNIDNDNDGLVDEDPGTDTTGDFYAGIMGIDDDNDGLTDEGGVADDDESGGSNEDAVDGIDNDFDGRVDEDSGGLFYGTGVGNDDDRDYTNNEDPFDPLIYYLNGTNLMERQNVKWVTTSDNVIAENVTQFEILRRRENGNTLIDIYLKLDDGENSVELRTSVLAQEMFKP